MRYSPFFCLLFLLCASVWSACSDAQTDQAETAEEDSAIPVRVTQVEGRTLEEKIDGVGSLRALTEVAVRPEVFGTVVGIHFEPGSRVERGQLLLEIESKELRRQIDAREAALRSARTEIELQQKTHRRDETLYQKGSIPRQALDESQARLEQARAQESRIESELEALRERLAETEIHSPMTGRITDTEVDLGEVVDVGTPVATIYQTSPLEVEFSIPERYLDMVRPGQPVEIFLTARPETTYQGEVTYVSPSVDPTTRDFVVKAEVENDTGSLKPGSFARARVTVASRRDVPVVPEEALIATREGYSVFVVQDGTVELRHVETGLRQPGWVEIESGVETGDSVVRQGHMSLSRGDRIKVVDESSDDTSSDREPES